MDVSGAPLAQANPAVLINPTGQDVSAEHVSAHPRFAGPDPGAPLTPVVTDEASPGTASRTGAHAYGVAQAPISIPLGTEIIGTIGPASAHAERLARMIEAGLSVARLDFTGSTPLMRHERDADTVRAAASLAGKEVEIMADLQGPRVALGPFAEQAIDLRNGQRFTLDPLRQAPGDREGVAVNYKGLLREVQPYDRLLLGDGSVSLRVVGVEGSEVHTEVEQGGRVGERMRLTREGGGLQVPLLGREDRPALDTAMRLGADWVTLPYAATPQDVEHFREIANRAGDVHGRTPAVLVKLERPEAMAAGLLPALVAASDGIVLERSQLSVELGEEQVPGLQRAVLDQTSGQKRYAAVAGEVFPSMQAWARPARSDVRDLNEAVHDGANAVILGAATAVGRDPVAAVEHAARILEVADAETRPGRHAR